jgi:hypothetical protein
MRRSLKRDDTPATVPNPCSHPACTRAGGEGDEGRKDRDAAAYRRALYDIMTCMRDVRKRADATDAMFEPLRDTVASLAGVGVALPEGVLRQVGGLRQGRGTRGWDVLLLVY